MFIPIGDTPNPRSFTPWVNWTLIGINVAVYLLISLPLSGQAADPNDPLLRDYIRLIAPSLPPYASLRQILAQASAYDLFTLAHGFRPGAPNWLDLLTSMFLHGGLLHLVGNMLFLWIYGDNVEHRLGRAGYLLAYLGTGAAATLTFSFLAGDSMVPLVGASGAISGVLGLYFVLFPRNRVKVFVALFPFYFDTWLLPARWVLGFYLLIDNLLPVVFGAQSNVAYGAHLGGFLTGLGVAWLGERWAWGWPWSDRRFRLGHGHRPSRPAEPRVAEGPLEHLRQALVNNDRKSALAAVLDLDRSALSRLQPAECVVLADWLMESSHPMAASQLLKRCLATHPTANDLAQVYLALGLMRLTQGQPTTAYQHLLSALDHDPDPQTETRIRAALERIDRYRRSRD